MERELKAKLIEARTSMDSEGKWFHGQRSGPGWDGVCLYLAACRYGGIMPALRDQIPEGFQRGDNFRTLAGYNDHKETTHADVMAVFDRAIAKASR